MREGPSAVMSRAFLSEGHNGLGPGIPGTWKAPARAVAIWVGFWPTLVGIDTVQFPKSVVSVIVIPPDAAPPVNVSRVTLVMVMEFSTGTPRPLTTKHDLPDCPGPVCRPGNN